MSWWGEWGRRVWYLANRRRLEAELRDEIEAHRAALGRSAGFGNATRLREDARDVWGWRWLDAIVVDVRTAARMLWRSRGFTAAVIASLVLGFTLLGLTLSTANAYLVRTLPYAAADRLFHVMYAPPGPWEPSGVGTLDWAALADVVEFPVTASGDTLYLTDGTYTHAASVRRASLGFVEGLGVRAVAGRTLMPADFSPDADPVAMLGFGLWRDRYGSDPAIVGRILHGESEGAGGGVAAVRIVGVLPPGFYFGRDSSATIDLLAPLMTRARTYMVRLRPGVEAAVAEGRITQAVRQVAGTLPSDWPGVRLEGAHDRYVAGVRPVLVGATVAALVVIAIVATNVAVLTLLRAMRRRREMAVRAALGSSPWQLLRLVLVEAGLLCAIAAVLSVIAARLALHALAPVIEAHLGRPAPSGPGGLTIDGPVLLAIGVIAVSIASALAVLPALAAWKRRLVDVLSRDRVAQADTRGTRRLRSCLVAVEVAGTLVLLVAGGSMVRGLADMLGTDLGFRPDGLIRTRIVLRGTDYADAAAFRSFYERFSARAASGVGAPIAFASWPPFAELPSGTVEIDGRIGSGETAGSMQVGAGYFALVGTSLRSGREFTDAEVHDDAPVAVVSQTLASRLWPDGAALGRQMRVVERTTDGLRAGPWRTVIGVAGDVRQVYGVTDVSEVYVPLATSWYGRYGSFYLRPSQPAPALWNVLRDAASEIDPHAVVGQPRLVTDENVQLAGVTFMSGLLGAYAVVAGLVALLGVYGVTACAVQQREREVAIRLALGAASPSVQRMFLKDAGIVVLGGVIGGSLALAAFARVTAAFFGAVPVFGPWLVAATAACLAAAALAAAWWPARRASHQNPMAVLEDG